MCQWACTPLSNAANQARQNLHATTYTPHLARRAALLSLRTGEVYGRYVPQSVNNKDGQPLDVDIVVNEIFNDGDELFVEFSSGPVPYKVR